MNLFQRSITEEWAIEHIKEALDAGVVFVDRWNVKITAHDGSATLVQPQTKRRRGLAQAAEPAQPSKISIPESFANDVSLGIIADDVAQYESGRGDSSSKLISTAKYVDIHAHQVLRKWVGAGKFKNFQNNVHIECNGDQIPPENYKGFDGISIMNSPSIFGGQLVGDPQNDPQMDDGQLEIVALSTTQLSFQYLKLGALHPRGRYAQSLGQCKRVKLKVYKHEQMTVDCEPINLVPGGSPIEIDISYIEKVPMGFKKLARPPKKSPVAQ